MKDAPYHSACHADPCKANISEKLVLSLLKPSSFTIQRSSSSFYQINKSHSKLVLAF